MIDRFPHRASGSQNDRPQDASERVARAVIQSAAIPYRINAEDKLQVLLVTSRRRRRWIIPKGKVKRGTLPSRSAEREAFEEAGVLGKVDKQPIGTYWRGEKRPDGSNEATPVQVFGLLVIDELSVWQEMRLRERRWFPIDEALRAVQDRELRAMLEGFRRLRQS